ncbi:MAG: ABC transporter ATP-binding protein [Acidimicrobiia bacterium]|nr:ABC transporter ATP-binding protein [Acidimicrobiia bacterium]MDH4364085.1 ABC transporter ATP-binding protein [Acidimicrobiia bacterium]MDH5289934.1 ABC transporter ATP-binding protein [Acidimicrobiia bacterium]
MTTAPATAAPPPGSAAGAGRAVLVSARNVRKGYGETPVLDDVTFDIGQGVTGLLGANGAGKTTLLGMILGLHPIDSGSLLIYGLDPWTAGADVRALTGYAPEHHTLPPDLRADEFVRHVAELHGLPAPEATTRASDALWLVGLGEERFRPMGTMSTGQRQRVKLAQAIAHDPRLILLDEPTDGLDPVQRDAMLDLIRHVASDFGINVVLSSHLLDEVERICDGAVIIGEGRVLASGTLDELRGEGQTGVVALIDGADQAVAAVAAWLVAAGFAATATGRHLSVEGDDDRVFDAVRDACVAHGVGMARLARRRLSLEDVFLERLG